MNPDKILVVIQGPTAIGKTDLAINLAKSLNTEVINADSRQVYKEMKIGTARPDFKELQGVKHHLLGHKSIIDEYNADIFALEARNCLKEIYKKGNFAVLSGGAGFYVNALLYGLDNIPEIPLATRNALNQDFETKGVSFLQKLLKEKDPVHFERVDLNNPQRLIRALEVTLHTGKPYSDFLNNSRIKLPYRIFNFALNMSREKLYQRINSRVDKMIENELEKEVLELKEFKHLNSLQTVGYSEFFEYFDEILSFSECVEQIKQNTRRFAKRQLTWLRRENELEWINLDEVNDPISKIKNYISDALA